MIISARPTVYAGGGGQVPLGPVVSTRFQTTHWSVVLAAAEADSPASRDALATLCQAYWPPLYAFVRRRGYAPAEAEDLTQSYFARLLEKNYLGEVRAEAGRFRSFLLASVSHFLANEWDREHARKRRPDRGIISLDADEAERRYSDEPADQLTPERLYERQWAATVLGRVLEVLRDEFVSAGEWERFDRLKSYLTGSSPAAPYVEVASELGLSEAAVKTAVHRLRRRYGELLRQEIGALVQDPSEVDDELRYLLRVVAP